MKPEFSAFSLTLWPSDMYVYVCYDMYVCVWYDMYVWYDIYVCVSFNLFLIKLAKVGFSMLGTKELSLR